MITNYGFLLFFFLLLLLVTFLLGLVAYILMRKQSSRAKLSSYECGFEPYNDARKSFYVNFYNIGLMFLLFDVEIILILPSLYSVNFLTSLGYFWLIFFILVLVLGYLYELSLGALTIRSIFYTK